MTGAALHATMDGRTRHSTSTLAALSPASEISHGADLAAHLIAARYGLALSIAKVVAFHAGLSSNDDRAPASGGRVKQGPARHDDRPNPTHSNSPPAWW